MFCFVLEVFLCKIIYYFLEVELENDSLDIKIEMVYIKVVMGVVGVSVFFLVVVVIIIYMLR